MPLRSADFITHTARQPLIERIRQWLRDRLGLDRAIGFTVLARSWAAISSLVTVGLIARFLSPAEQGYYYTFASLVAIQIVFELGFSSVILQMASHERAHLSISPDHVVSGDPVAHARLASVLQKSIRWYTIAALILCASLIPTGLYFFAARSNASQPIAWRIPWICDVIAATLTFQIDPVFSFLEGCGYVPQVAKTRFRQAITGAILAWTALVLHRGLFAPAMMILGQALAGGSMLFSRRHLLQSLMRYAPGSYRIRWGKEVWPFQWRIAVSWICGYFVFQLFTPILFTFWGPLVAGQFGMSASICGGLASVAVSWISTKAAPFGTMIARKQFVELDSIFFRSLWQALGVMAAGAIPAWLVVFYLSRMHMKFASRLLNSSTFAMLLLATAVNIVVTAEATYLRAHKQEKWLPVSILSALLMIPSTYFLGKRFAAEGMTAGYLAILVVISLGYGTSVFRKYRRLWHKG
jgi:hypothetical protein